MRPSRNSGGLILGCWIAVHALWAAPVLAQQATGVPRSILPTVSQETAGSADVMDQGVEASALTDAPLSLGPLGPANGGFGPTLWRGTPPATVTALMSRLPVTEGSPVAHNLARRLLLSAAALQSDVAADGAARQGLSAADRQLLALRLEKLAERGDLEGAVALAAAAGEELPGDAAAALKTDVFLLGDDYERACATALVQVERSATPDWLKVLAFCRALMGDRAGAALTVELLRETAADLPEFYLLLDHMLLPEPRPPVTLETLQPPSALMVAMALLAGSPLPADVMDGAAPLLLAKLSLVPSLAPAHRLTAAWNVARRGGLEPERLRQLYAALPFAAQERRAAAVVAPSLDEASAMALFTQAIAGADDMAERVRLVQAAARHARDIAALPMLAVLTADQLTAIPPDIDNLAAAPDMVRLLLLAGNEETARTWYDALRAQADAQTDGLVESPAADHNPAAVTAVIDLWPLMRVAAAGDDLPVTPEVLELWWRHQQPLRPADRARRLAVFLALAETLGLAPPEGTWAWIADAPDAMTGAMPSDDMWQEFTAATSQGRVGEAVLTTLVVMGADGPGGLSPLFLAAAVRGLIALDLDKDARRLAAEAMIAQGF